MQHLRRTIYRCADCLAVVGTDPIRWYFDNGLWQPVCYDCWFARFEVEKSAAVAWASFECKAHGYELDNPQPAVIRERRKVGDTL